MGRRIFLDNLQVSLDITSRSLDECGSAGAIWLDNNFIADIVSEHVVVLCECVDGLEVLVQQVCSPCRGVAVNGTIQR